jgi:hypothetical protein
MVVQYSPNVNCIVLGFITLLVSYEVSNQNIESVSYSKSTVTSLLSFEYGI